jgi:hypothetical protein
MKNLTLLLLCILALSLTKGISQPGEDTFYAKDEHPKTIRLIEGDCIRIVLDLGKQLIVRDCPDYDNFEFDLDKKFGIQVEPLCLPAKCHVKVELFFEGQLLFEQSTSAQNQSIHLPVDYHHLESLLSPDFHGVETELELLITKICLENNGDKFNEVVYYDPVYQRFPIQVRYPGDKYLADIRTNDRTISVCEELYDFDMDKIRKIDLCCAGQLNISFHFNQTSGTNISLTGSISHTENLGFLNSDFSIAYNVTEYQINEVFQSFGINYDLLPDGDGCVYPGISIRLLTVQKCLFEVNCHGPDTKDVVLEEYDEIVEINPFPCKYHHECPSQDPKPKLEQNPGSQELFEYCRADLNLSLDNPLPDMKYEVQWTGPDGTVYHDWNLQQVPYGKYELTVFDECCQEYHYTFNLCDELNYSDWYYENGQYCREVECLCDEIATPRNDEVYTMCVIPHRYGDWYLNESTKQCNRPAYWTDQNGLEINLTAAVDQMDILLEDKGVVKEPSRVEEYYNELENRCIREYYCLDDQACHFIEHADPFYEAWSYDAQAENCYREVLCFGTQAMDENGHPFEAESSDPAYGSWEYDDFWETCYRKIYCSGTLALDEWGDEILDEAESLEIDWTVENDGDLECVGIVYCEEEELEESISESPDTEWFYDEYNDQCSTLYLYCDGHDQDNISEDPYDYGEWYYSAMDETCKRDIYCETAGQGYEQSVEAYFAHDPYNYGDCDQEEAYESYQVWCGDYGFIDEYVCFDYIPLNSLGDEELGERQKKSQSIKNSNDASHAYYKVVFYTSDGRKLSEFKTIEEAQLRDYLDNPAVLNPLDHTLIFYTVYGEEQFLYSGKLFYQKN